MIIFSFPGTGKTSLAGKYAHVVDLELSEFKYDNSSVAHLSKEERKSLKRPIKNKGYKQDYVREALRLHQSGKVVLVALNFLLPILWQLLWRGDLDFRVFFPRHQLREEYRARYLKRGNNTRFIWEVMTIWSPTILSLTFLSYLLPVYFSPMESGEYLEKRLDTYLYKGRLALA